MPQPLRVVFFGDSICVGQQVSPHRTWVARLAARLEQVAAAAGTGLLAVNASVNGNTTRLALERMPQDVQKDGVDVLLVQFGLNDANYWETDRGVPRVSPEAFAANLAEIVERGYRFGARQVVLHTNHPTARDQAPLPHFGQPYESSNRRYNAIVREVAARLSGRVELTDVEAAFRGRTGDRRERLLELLQPAPDWLHPNEAGHDLYLEVAGPPLERAVAAALAASRAPGAARR